MIKVLEKIYDNRRNDSLATNLRQKRLNIFESIIESSSNNLRILDVGGTELFWKNSGILSILETKNIEITILNILEVEVNTPGIKSVVGDGTNMKEFADNYFDIVFSNSAIEHVGSYISQQKMANEIKRVGKRYFVQTPNRYFPIEPHYMIPLFQFFPFSVKFWITANVPSIWTGKKAFHNKEDAKRWTESIRLLTKQEFIKLFPDAKIYEEKFLGIDKSFIAYQ
jgi:hypothetical protein